MAIWVLDVKRVVESFDFSSITCQYIFTHHNRKQKVTNPNQILFSGSEKQDVNQKNISSLSLLYLPLQKFLQKY